MPTSSSAAASSRPAGPTNGAPARSSRSPAISPTNMSRARRSPSPKTVCVAPLHRWHPRQDLAASRSVFSDLRSGRNGRASFGSGSCTSGGSDTRLTRPAFARRFSGQEAGNRWSDRNEDGRRMKAVVFHGIGDVRLDEVQDPVITDPTDAIVRLTSSAICGTDLHFVRGTMPGTKEGRILGHEGVGIVEELGDHVRNLNVGDRVVIPSTIACGTCVHCRAGYYAQCDVANPN